MHFLLNTRFGKELLATIFAKIIRKKLGDCSVEIKTLQIDSKDGRLYIRAAIDADISEEEFSKAINSWIF